MADSRHDARHAEWLAVRQACREEHLAGKELRIAEHVFGGVDAAGRDFGSRQHRQHFLQGLRGDPAVDNPIEFVAARIAPVVAGQLRVAGQVVAADGLHEAAEDRVAVGADLYVAAIGAGVDGGGVMPGMMLPVRSRMKPNTSNSGTMLSIMAKIAS